MKYIPSFIKGALQVVSALVLGFISFMLGGFFYLYDFRKNTFWYGVKFLNHKTQWVKRIIGIIILGVFLTACQSKSGHRVPITRDYKDTLQVMHDGGYVEEIENNKHISTKAGDTILLKNSTYLLPSGKVMDYYGVWGKLSGKMPENIYLDSVSIEFYKVVVLK